MADAKVYVVFDTNVFVPAIAGVEEEQAALGALVRICHSLAVSSQVVEEYKRVVYRYGFTELVVIYRQEELKAMGKLTSFDKRLDDVSAPKVDVPPKDLPFLQVAIAANASYLITKDFNHFISKQGEIKAQYNITVLKPRQYYDLCEAMAGGGQHG